MEKRNFLTVFILWMHFPPMADQPLADKWRRIPPPAGQARPLYLAIGGGMRTLRYFESSGICLKNPILTFYCSAIKREIAPYKVRTSRGKFSYRMLFFF